MKKELVIKKTNTSSVNKDLYSISREVYGTEEYVYVLAELNNCNMYKKYSIDELSLPSANNMKKYMELSIESDSYGSITNYYVVEKGDTLFKISRKIYKMDKYINFIVDINALKNKDLLNTETILYIPKL